MIYRRLDTNGDYAFGNNMNDFLSDIDAVAQAIRTRIMLFLGEWWEDTSDGLPMWQNILGTGPTTKEIRDKLIQERILGTTGVRNLEMFYSTLVNGKYQVQTVINTIYGQVIVNNLGQGTIQR